VSGKEGEQANQYLGNFLQQIPNIARRRSAEYGEELVIGDMSRLLGLKSIQRLIMRDCGSLEVPNPLVMSASRSDRERAGSLLFLDLAPMFYADEEGIQVGKYSVSEVAREVIKSNGKWLFKPDWGDKSQGIFLIRSDKGQITVTIDDGVQNHESFPLHKYLVENFDEIDRVPNKLIEFAIGGVVQDELEKIFDLGAVMMQHGPYDSGLVEPLIEDTWEYDDRPFETRHIVTSEGDVEHILAKVGRPNVLDGNPIEKYERLHPDGMYTKMAEESGLNEEDIIEHVEKAVSEAYEHFMERIVGLGFDPSQIDELQGQSFNLQFDIKYLPSKTKGNLPELALVEVHIMIGDERVDYNFSEE